MVFDSFIPQITGTTHTLIAGSSGSGKSVLINQICDYIACRGNSLISCIDLKRVELLDYKDIRQCVGYADTISSAGGLLDDTSDIIEKRYKKMCMKKVKMTTESHIYLIVDEIADLFLTDKSTSKQIQHIMQIGRAAGVHVIAATQYVPVISTSIRANVSCKIALHTATAQDSRNIIGIKGAETLPKYGKCLYCLDGEYFKSNIRPTDTIQHNMIIDHYRR